MPDLGMDRIDDTEEEQPLVALVGTSMHFSDQMLRVLKAEFEGVQFRRISDPGQLFVLGHGPAVIIVHEKVTALEALVGNVHAAYPDALIAIACGDAAIVRRLNGSGGHPAVSLLQMNAQIDVWLSVLRLLLCGHLYVPADMAEGRDVAHAADTGSETQEETEVQLTPRELEILPLIAIGKQNKLIARELGLSEHTVKLHTHNIFSKLRVSNRTGAANWYLSQEEMKRNADYRYRAK